MNLYRQPHSGSLRRRIEKDNILLFESFTFLPCGYSPCIPLWEHPVKLRDTAGGEGEALIRSLCCGYFWTPPSLCVPSPYILFGDILHRATRNGKGRVSPQPHYFGELYLSFSPVWRWPYRGDTEETVVSEERGWKDRIKFWLYVLIPPSLRTSLYFAVQNTP